MGFELDQSDTPTNVEVERFARRTIVIGFTGGQEKTIEYDTRATTQDSEEQYRKYVETERVAGHDKKLSEAVHKRNQFTVVDKDDVSYRQFEGVEKLFLVSWDSGQTIRIMSGEEVDNLLDVAAFHEQDGEDYGDISESSRRLLESDEPDTDIPVDDEPPEPESPSNEESNENTNQGHDTDIPEPVATGQ